VRTLTPAVSRCGEDATATGDVYSGSEREATFYDGQAYHGKMIDDCPSLTMI